MADCVMFIPLRAQDGSLRARATVDAERYDELAQFRWFMSSEGYAVRNRPKADGRGILWMHRVVLGIPYGDPRRSDHANRDRLDNRLANLRIATAGENMQNLPGLDRTSRHRGVCWHRASGKWMARQRLDGHIHYLGLYVDEDEAARVAAEWRADHMPFSEEGRAA